jgi:hypothetical protein
MQKLPFFILFFGWGGCLHEIMGVQGTHSGKLGWLAASSPSSLQTSEEEEGADAKAWAT